MSLPAPVSARGRGLAIGIIGTGLMGADHARTIVRDVTGARLVAIADADLERAQDIASTVAGCTTFDDPMALIASGDVDAVVIASPDATHEAFVLACVASGKPCLCEKPLAPSVEACLRIIEAERAVGRRLVQVGFMRRFDPGYVAMKARLDAGEIGRALMVHCVHRNESTQPTYTSDMLITNSAIHEMDTMRWLLGEELTSVTVHVPAPAADVPDFRDPLFIVFRTTSGVIVDVEVFVNAGYGYDVRCQIVGQNGVLDLAPSDVLTRWQRGLRSVDLPNDYRIRFADAYRLELQDWVASAAAGMVRGPDAHDGYMAAAVARATLESLRSGAPVEVRLTA
ncbi:MAG: Gfo/Idh/MocA family oxidoreductase [Candidatus Limnocylindrales bacterium]